MFWRNQTRSHGLQLCHLLIKMVAIWYSMQALNNARQV